MKKILTIFVLISLVAFMSGCTEKAEPAQTGKNRIATIETGKGIIKFELYEKEAPITTKNFIDLAQKGFYDGLTFHRVIRGFMIQGGDPRGDGMGGPGYTIPDEFGPVKHDKEGKVPMANAGPNTG